MEVQDFNAFQQTYETFRYQLKNDITNHQIISSSEDCCLIDKLLFSNYINQNTGNRPFNSNSSLKIDELLIKDFASIIYYLKNNKKFELINKSSINIIFKNKYNSLNLPYVEYYGGYNKIIIMFKGKNDKPLLLINPLDDNQLKERTFVLSIKNIDLYRDLLIENNNANIIKKFQKYVSSLDNYNPNNISIKKIKNDKTSPQKQSQIIFNNKKNISPKKIDNISQIDNKELIHILEILIKFFYYEKFFIENKNQIFNENNNNYYLIKQEWLKNYLEQYKYINLYKSLLNISKSNPKINYYNLNQYLPKFIEIYFEKNLINVEKGIIKQLTDTESIFEKTNIINNNLSFNNCYIIHSKIIDLINEYQFQNKDISNNLKKIYVKNEFIYFIDGNNLIIGNINAKLFVPKYIINYYSKQLLEKEKNIISNNCEILEDYLKIRNYKNNNSLKQSLIDENTTRIGSITVLNQNQKNNETLNNNKITNISNNQNIGPGNGIYSKNPKDKGVSLNKNINVNINPIKTGNGMPNKKITKSTINKKQGIYSKKVNIIKMNNTSENNKVQYNLGQIQTKLKNNNSKGNSPLNKINKNIMKNNKSIPIKEFYNKDNNIDNNEQLNSDNLKKTINDLKVKINNKDKEIQKMQDNINKQKEEYDIKIKKCIEEKDMLINNLKKEYSILQDELNNNKKKFLYETDILGKELENTKAKMEQIQNENMKQQNNLNDKDIKLIEQIKINEQIKNELNNSKGRNYQIEEQKNNSKIEEQNKEINILKERNEYLEKQNELILNEKESIIKDLQSKYLNAQNELKKINEQFNSNKDELININQKFDQIQNENDEYKRNILEKDEQIKNYEETVDNKEKIIQELKSSNTNLSNQLNISKMNSEEQKTLNEEKESMKNELMMIKNKNDELINTIKERENEIIQLNNKCNYIQNILNNQNDIINKNKSIETEYLDMKKKLEMIENENNIIKRDIDKKNQLNTELNNNNGILQKKFDEQININYNMNKELEKYRTVNEENKRINQENQLLKQKNQELQNIINNLNNKISNMNNNTIPTSIREPKPPIRPIKEIEPLDLYDRPTLIGLNNIGATCFMNSTLQCLSQTKYLTNYFLKDKSLDKIINNNIAVKNRNAPQLSPIYLDLIKQLWNSQNRLRSYSPNNFMSIIEKMNPLFKQGQAGDSKDFIIFVLEQFHKELKRSVKQNNSNFTISNQALNQYDKNNAFNHFFNEFQEDCSIISDIFFGINETTNICVNCKNNFNSRGLNNPICYNYGIFNCLIFPLEEVKKMKNNSMQYNNYININQNNRVSIYECFYYNQKTDLFTGDNKNFCNNCKQLYDSFYTTTIFTSPIILVLILNRGKDNIYNVKIDFTETIDISQFVLQKDIPQMIYNLYGVITHIGQSGPNAHFVAFCKSPIDNKWYKYNDAIVSSINNLQKEVIDFGTPYILFYEKINK